jgi:primary-amine oxidase
MSVRLRRAVPVFVLVGLAGLAVLAASGRPPAAAQPQPIDVAPPADAPPGPNVVRQGFPAAAADPDDLTRSETAWEIEWELTHPLNKPYTPPGCTLRIKSARFLWHDRSGQPQWITVVRMLELAEIYVPYDDGTTAFLDVHDMSFYVTPARREFLGPPCVAPGEVLPSPANPAWANTVHKEVHDDGVRWMSAETNDRNQIADRVRRGEKLVLWATYYGANYRYMMEYGFGDDGTITCRIGPTGRNIFNRRPDLRDTHLHVGCWRFEPDLGGPKDNDILHVRRVFDDATERFGQVARPFAKNALGEASEGSARWVAEEFTTVRMQSKVRKSAHGRAVGYDLIPHRFGALRQLQNEGGASDADMEFINNDFWVTRTEPGNTSYVDVPRYARQRRPLAGHPTTVWHCAPALHVARGEDFGPDGGGNSYTGVAIASWTGFYLKPRDLFDGTPLYRASPPRAPRFGVAFP